MAASPSDKNPKKPILRDETKGDRWGTRPEPKPASLPMGTLMDATSTIRFVSPGFAAEQARRQPSAWDRAKKVETPSSTATTAMSDLPARVVAELRARRAAEEEAAAADVDTLELDDIPTIDVPMEKRRR